MYIYAMTCDRITNNVTHIIRVLGGENNINET